MMERHFDKMDQQLEEHFNSHDQICENPQNKNSGNDILFKKPKHYLSFFFKRVIQRLFIEYNSEVKTLQKYSTS